ADKAAGARQPIWITVEVPPDAAPGIYEAGLTVSATGAAPIEVPVRLRVHDWKVPDSREFTSHIGLVQSPDSVAMRYKVPMWSDRHWALMEKSFQLLGKVGNDYIWIPVMRRSHFGNEHGMVRFVRKVGAAAGGGADSQQVTAETHAPDLSVAERYLD
ncbi:MAG: DUF6067 family protein, partial [Planctomycetota bacterium]|nr:DUF6067 family protein [Planctomycetota bacterium]